MLLALILLSALSSASGFKAHKYVRCSAIDKQHAAVVMVAPSGAGTTETGELLQEVFKLDTGLSMEVLSMKGRVGGEGSRTASRGAWLNMNPKVVSKTPPLVFVHGSFHSSWCWAEHFMPFFADQGYDVYAISCRGTSRSPIGPKEPRSVKIRQHADDLQSFIISSCRKQVKPVLIGHSFGGSIVMKMLEQSPQLVSAAGFLCSVPPSGNQAMTGRFIKRDFWLALKITIGLAAKKAAEWPWLARELLFEHSLSDDDLVRYVRQLKNDSVVDIDVKDFLNELPSLRADAEGRAPWVSQVPAKLVLGATDDKIVDNEGVEEMARFAGVSASFVPTAHDVMLGPSWELAADRILQWLRS